MKMGYWKASKYTKKQVSHAGLNLANGKIDDADLAVINEFRYSHDSLTKALYTELGKIEMKKVMSRRLKRTPAIIHKIKRSIDAGNTTQLSRMQDVGGCRCILETIDDVYALYEIIKKQGLDGFVLKKEIDYISHPKKDGYRGIHCVFEYANGTDFDGLKVELQLRTKLQHSRSTAIEIVDSINDAKMKFGEGDEEYRSFFKRTSVLFAKKEGYKPTNRNKALKKAREIEKSSKILGSLAKRTISYDFVNWYHNQTLKSHIKGDVIIQLTRTGNKLQIKKIDGKTSSEMKKIYLEMEKNSINNKYVDIVYLSSQEIEVAYPNYVGDAKIFVKECSLLLK